MTHTDSRRRRQALDQIGCAIRGRFGAMFKSGVFIVVIGGTLLLVLKTLDAR